MDLGRKKIGELWWDVQIKIAKIHCVDVKI